MPQGEYLHLERAMKSDNDEVGLTMISSQGTTPQLRLDRLDKLPPDLHFPVPTRSHKDPPSPEQTNLKVTTVS